MARETQVTNLVINKMRKDQYNSITPSDTELYFITDDTGLTESDIAAFGFTKNQGTVTSITPGNGLLNGTETTAITTSGTLNINYGGAPSDLGSTASAGTANTVSRSDHVHKYPTAAQVGAAASSHTHGNITNDGKIGNTKDQAVYTTDNGVLTCASFAVTEPTANGTATAFISGVSQDSKGKISASKASLPNAATNVAGIMTLGAAGGAATYSHTHQYLPLSGGTMIGTLTLKADPANNLEAATKQYVDNAFTANDAMVFKGTIGTGGNPATLPTTHKQGWTYRVIAAGTYAGKVCEIGDLIICITDGTATNNDHWIVAQANIDGAVTGPASSTENNIATYNNNSGKVIKDSGKSITTSAPDSSSGDTTIPTSKAVWTRINNYLPLAGGTMSGAINMAAYNINGVRYLQGQTNTRTNNAQLDFYTNDSITISNNSGMAIYCDDNSDSSNEVVVRDSFAAIRGYDLAFTSGNEIRVSKNGIILTGCYSDTLPETGVEGQIFFKLRES